jgi:predicted aspartyl protease
VNGIVDASGRALVTLNVRATEDGPLTAVNAWIDTAFSGELVVPRRIISDLSLQQAAAVEAKLADGRKPCY